MANTKYTVELELTETEKKVFDEYIDGNCFDAKKWLSRQLYWGVYSAINRYKQPKNTVNPALKASSLEKKAKKPLAKVKPIRTGKNG
jgi:hypothetical protein